MRIGFDARMIEQGPGGNRRYTHDLLAALAAEDRENDYILYHLRPAQELPTFPFRSVTWRRVRPAHPLARLSLGFPFQLWRDGVDLFHGQYHLPLWVGAPAVVTVHDVSFARIPDLYSFQERLLTSLLVSSAVRRAAAVITVSNHARQAIIDLYACDPQKVVTIHEAASQHFRPVRDPGVIERVRAKYGIPLSYGLYVGRLEPRKNLVRLLQAWARVSLNSGASPTLVIVGPKSFGYQDIFAAVSEYELGDRVIFTGAISEEELPVLYSGARLFVYPSLYEGFGLPVLEAMQCGAPVIAANCTSLPEIVGDAGILINPYSVEEIAKAVALLWHDEELQASLREKGLTRAAQFSWRKTAAETKAVYERVASGR